MRAFHTASKLGRYQGWVSFSKDGAAKASEE
jgi:hypothetical protein